MSVPRLRQFSGILYVYDCGGFFGTFCCVQLVLHFCMSAIMRYQNTLLASTVRSRVCKSGVRGIKREPVCIKRKMMGLHASTPWNVFCSLSVIWRSIAFVLVKRCRIIKELVFNMFCCAQNFTLVLFVCLFEAHALAVSDLASATPWSVSFVFCQGEAGRNHRQNALPTVRGVKGETIARSLRITKGAFLVAARLFITYTPVLCTKFLSEFIACYGTRVKATSQQDIDLHEPLQLQRLMRICASCGFIYICVPQSEMVERQTVFIIYIRVLLFWEEGNCGVGRGMYK